MLPHKAFGQDLICKMMQLKMLVMLLFILSIVYSGVFTLLAFAIIGSSDLSQARTLVLAKIISPILPGTNLSFRGKDGSTLSASAITICRSPTLKKTLRKSIPKFLLTALLSLPVYALFPLIVKRYKKLEKNRQIPKHLEGSKLLEPIEFKALIEFKYSNCFLPFGGWYDDKKGYHQIRFPVALENSHIGIFGSTRSGKTVMMSQMLHSLRKRGDIAFILDQKGDYLPMFYDPEKDHVLNVLDERCANWIFWNDLIRDNQLLRQAELETVAAGLIPDGKEGAERFFCDAARAVLVGLLISLDRQQKHTYSDLWAAVNQPRDNMAQALADINHRGHVYISEPGKQSQGVISTLMQYSRVFEYAAILDRKKDDVFTLDDWLLKGEGFLYLANYDAIRETLSPMLTMFLNFAAKKILSGRENVTGRRIWFFLDEFGSLHKISSLLDILTRGGSKGVCVVLATQDRGQIEDAYGRNLTDAVFNSCNSWAALRCKDPATARLAVDRAGEWRFQRQEESVTDKIDDGGDSVNISKRIHREKLMLDSQIMGQDPLEAYVHVDGCQLAHLEINKIIYEQKHPAFLPVTGMDLQILNKTNQSQIKEDIGV